MRSTLASLVVSLLTSAICLTSASAQTSFPWVVFDDPFSDSLCSVVHAANAELVLLAENDQLVIVSGPDEPINAVVDAENNVIVGDEFAGVLSFAVDGDGQRSVWWTGLTGEVIRIDPLTGEPTVTDERPNNFRNTTCEACDLWDDPAPCAEPEEPEVPPVTVNLCG